MLTFSLFWKLKIKIAQKMNFTDLIKRVGNRFPDKFYEAFSSRKIDGYTTNFIREDFKNKLQKLLGCPAFLAP